MSNQAIPGVLSRSKIKYLLALFPICIVVVLDLRRQAFVLRLAYGKNCCASYFIFEWDTTLGNRPLSALTTNEIQKFYNTIKKNGRVRPDKQHGTEISDSMVRKIHLLLHESLDMAVMQRLLVSNPTNGTTIPKNNYKDKQILNDEQLDRFIEVINVTNGGKISSIPRLQQVFVKEKYVDCDGKISMNTAGNLKYNAA